MSQMIFFTRHAHDSFRLLYKRFPSSRSFKHIHHGQHPPRSNISFSHRHCQHQHSTFLNCPSSAWYTRNGLTIRNAIGGYFGLATSPTGPSGKSPETEENSKMGVVIKEIRVQEKNYHYKIDRSQANEIRKINRLVVDHEEKLDHLRSAEMPGIYFDQFQPHTVRNEKKEPEFIEDNNRITQIFTHSDPPLSGVRSRIDKKLGVPLVSNLIQAKEPFKDPSRIPKPAQIPKIIYPKTIEKPQLSFKFPQIKISSDIKKPTSSTLISSSIGPKFEESSTQRVKMLMDNSVKPSDTIANDLNSLKYKVDVKSRILRILGQYKRSDVGDGRSTHSEVEVFKGPVDMLGNPIPPPESKLITSMMDKEMHVVPVDGQGKKEQNDDGDGDDKSRSSKRSKKWTGIKYTFGILGLATTCMGGYIMFLIGSPKFDEDGNIILDKYSHMPIVLQYLYRIKEEFENYNKMIKEPSRDKLLPDTLLPPYYQPPYTLILEFTDLLVHPEWTYSTGWRFKKRPGVDQFLEALYTRFEVVVYTAQMGMTVFPILEALDSKNLISYKLVRDATNFVEGDHVKDLDKLNRDLSKVVVVDWNPQSVKLHKSNLFKIPRWDGNDEDRTFYDLAAFLIAISEWEVQDVRTVLEYYGQFDNPLSKFKENQMQVLKSAES